MHDTAEGSPTQLPRISIVTPSFNQAEYLEETMSSVLAQGYPNLEYIVVDGGSTDESVNIIRRHETGIRRWLSEPDKGHAHALNKGFALTTGDIMGWLNSSDIYYPWTLAIVGDIFRDLPEVEWIEGIPTHVDVDSRPKTVGGSLCNRYDLLVGHECTIQQESAFWRRSLWERAGGRLDDSLRLACDYELWLRFSRHAPLHHPSTILAGFRLHADRRGLVLREDYSREAQRVREAELKRLPVRERWRIAMLRYVIHMGGRRAGNLLAHAKVLRWYRHPRVVYDFSAGKWGIV